MKKMNSLLNSNKSRIGFHYFPDTLHYRENDLQHWLPELTAMKVSWLILESPMDRAIPENFISGLIQAGIQPIVHFKLAKIGSEDKSNQADPAKLEPILSSYARWGVHHVIFFDKPNNRSSWVPSAWVQQALVERFLQEFLPLANQAIQHGLNPIFPPLEPGGNYWDTAFLRAALEALVEKKQTMLLQNLVIAAYGWNKHNLLNWGSGGPMRWTETHPYFTPANQEDQRGFRIFDWYNAITQAVLQKSCPIILLGAGSPNDPLDKQSVTYTREQHTAVNLAIVRLLNGEKVNEPQNPETLLDPVPDFVIASNFWLLTTDLGDPFQNQAWVKENGEELPTVQVLKNYFSKLDDSPSLPVATPSVAASSTPAVRLVETPKTASVSLDDYQPLENDSHESIGIPIAKPKPVSPKPAAAVPAPSGDLQQTANDFNGSSNNFQRPIAHYLLLPSYDWGVADWHLEVIKPFIKKYKPTIGFSIKEAALAKRVTVIGNTQTFPDALLDQLRKVGCLVERISGDGTSIASQLAER